MRGGHAHYETKQILFPVIGSCEVILDDGKRKQPHPLKKDDFIFQNKMIWSDMINFSEDCVLMVAADTLYDAVDYIRIYADFCNIKLGRSDKNE